MKTDFFSRLSELNYEGALQLQISKSSDNGFVVSVFLKNDQADDPSKKLIPPAILSGTPEDLDAGFFSNISVPIQQTSDLFLNMVAYKNQSEEAAKNSKEEKDRVEKEKKEKEKRGAKFKELMALVDKLEKEGKYKEAIAKLPNKEEFKDRAEEIIKKRNSLSSHLSPLFGDFSDETKDKVPEEIQEEEEEQEEEQEEEEEEEEEEENY